MTAASGLRCQTGQFCDVKGTIHFGSLTIVIPAKAGIPPRRLLSYVMAGLDPAILDARVKPAHDETGLRGKDMKIVRIPDSRRQARQLE
jgi:hypothetical protein